MSQIFSSSSKRFLFLLCLFVGCTVSMCLPEGWSADIEALYAQLRSKDSVVKEKALKTFMSIYFPEDEEKGHLWSAKEARLVVKIVKLLLSDPNQEIRLRAIGYAWQSTSAEAVEAVTTLFDDPVDRVRSAAVGVFSFANITSSVAGKIERLLNDGSREVRLEAARALNTHCTQIALDQVRQAALKESDEEVRTILNQVVACGGKN